MSTIPGRGQGEYSALSWTAAASYVHVVCAFLMTRVIFSHRMGSTLAQAAGQALLLHLCGGQK
jgi:hypothetical protein